MIDSTAMNELPDTYVDPDYPEAFDPAAWDGSMPPPMRERLPPLAMGLLFALLAMAARLSIFVRRRDFGSFAAVDTMAAAEIGIVLVSLVLVAMANRLADALDRAKGSGVSAFLGFMVVGVFSALWSPMWAYTTYRAVSVLSQFLALLVLFSYHADFHTAERRFLQLGGIVLLLQWLAIGRSSGLGGMFSLGPLHNNTLATSAAMVACYCIGESLAGLSEPGRARSLRRLGGLALVAVVVSTSSGSNVAMLMGLLFACILVRRSDLFVLLVVVGAIGSAFMSIGSIQSAVLPDKTHQQIVTLRGRTGLWSMYIDRLRGHWLLGEGYAVSARLGSTYSTNTHNVYMSAIMGTGILGSVFFLFANLQMTLRLMQRTLTRTPGAVGACSALVAGLANGMTKGFLGESYYPETLVFFSIFALAALHILPEFMDGYPPPYGWETVEDGEDGEGVELG